MLVADANNDSLRMTFLFDFYFTNLKIFILKIRTTLKNMERPL
jgi:hypothetical protein